MKPFDFIVLLFSFIYTLALTHLLFAATRMIRYRRTIRFSWPHALWMVDALVLLTANWIGLWDLHKYATLSLAMITVGMLFLVTLYFICALVTPELEEGKDLDLVLFHERESSTYIGAFLAGIVASAAVNFAGGELGIANWAQQNVASALMIPTVLVPLLWRNAWVQLVAPAILLVLLIIVVVLYYPAIA